MYFWALIFIFSCTSAVSIPLPKHSPTPGGIAIVTLTGKNEGKPRVTFMTKPVMVKQQETPSKKWLAIVGIDINTKPGRYPLEVKKRNGVEQIFFDVKAKSYPTEHLQIINQNLVSPDAKSLERIQNESALMKKAYSTFSSHSIEMLKINLPVQGRFSSPYGLRRFMNGIPKNPHKGLDIAAPLGTPINAAREGKVILSDNFFYSGNTIIIDHGEGFISSYAHLDKIETSVGSWVETNQVIGTVGSTGRVTGPHLHLSVVLNGNLVDPSLFLN